MKKKIKRRVKVKCDCILVIWKLSALCSSSSRVRHLEFCLYGVISCNNVAICIFCLCVSLKKQWLKFKNNKKMWFFSCTYAPIFTSEKCSVCTQWSFFPPVIQVWSLIGLVLTLLFSSEAQRSPKDHQFHPWFRLTEPQASSLKSAQQNWLWLWSAKVESGHTLVLSYWGDGCNAACSHWWNAAGSSLHLLNSASFLPFKVAQLYRQKHSSHTMFLIDHSYNK